MCTPDSSHIVAAECRRLCMPTPSMATVFAAFSTTRSRLCGSTGAPSSVVNTSPEAQLRQQLPGSNYFTGSPAPRKPDLDERPPPIFPDTRRPHRGRTTISRPRSILLEPSRLGRIPPRGQPCCFRWCGRNGCRCCARVTLCVTTDFRCVASISKSSRYVGGGGAGWVTAYENQTPLFARALGGGEHRCEVLRPRSMVRRQAPVRSRAGPPPVHPRVSRSMARRQAPVRSRAGPPPARPQRSRVAVRQGVVAAPCLSWRLASAGEESRLARAPRAAVGAGSPPRRLLVAC